YSSLGWYNYYSLDEAYNFLDLQTWQILVNEANSIGASTEYTIVAIKSTYNPNSYTKGPLLTTTWGQDWPFNAACGPNGTPSNPTLSVYPSNHKVGCVAVAAGQIMNYHKEPKSYFIPSNHPNADLFHPTPGWDVIFNWTNMSISATSSMPKLLRAVGEVVYMNYGFSTSSAFLSGIYALENKYGYTDVTEAYHDAAIVKANLSANKPVIMFGVKPSAVIGHSWVCDGVKYNTTITEYFVNFSVNNSYGSYYAYTPFNPGKLSAIAIDGENYNMNWGEGGKNNGWFYDNSFPSGYNFYNSRINYYVTP
ncbi:MAG: C10 family peptidase, partial [Bacteroidales bacterium]|nr:C10 family peptidase [Bacteroidales bacterium]